MEFLYKDTIIKSNADTLLARGFKHTAEKYVYECPLEDGAFLLRLTIDGYLHDEVIDLQTNEPYSLYKLSSLSSGFAYAIKQNVESIIQGLFPELSNDSNPFALPCFLYLEEAMTKRFDEPTDNPFEDEDIRIFRLKQNRKWYGIAMQIPAKKLGFAGDNEIFGLCVRVEKGCAEKYIDHMLVFPAYHMNKKNWVNLVLDDRLTQEEILDYLLRSRSIVIAGK